MERSRQQQQQQPPPYAAILIRQYDPAMDRLAAEAVDRKCNEETTGEMSLHMDYFGDPAARIRHSPVSLMLVAESTRPEKEIVGVVLGCVKMVTCGSKASRPTINDLNSKTTTPNYTPSYSKFGYILGLRVSPSHRRMGIGLKLVKEMEEWFMENGAEYAYMATEKDNEASLQLFTERSGYSKLRTPSILVHPVFAHRLPPPRSAFVFHLPPSDAEAIYRHRLAARTELFPLDIDAVLACPPTVATLLSAPAAWARRHGGRWPGAEEFLASPPASWAVASVWDCRDSFKLEILGASLLLRLGAASTRAVDRAAPWMRIPSVPDLFRPFGVWFVYGIGGEGPEAAAMSGATWREAHNEARGKAALVATEVAAGEPLRRGIAHWGRLSIPEDIWCAKRLGGPKGDVEVEDWTKSPPGPSIFVDPRDL